MAIGFVMQFSGVGIRGYDDVMKNLGLVSLVDTRVNNSDVISWRDATSSTQTPSW